MNTTISKLICFISVLLFLLFYSLSINAQEDGTKKQKKMFYSALEYMYDGKFQKALDILYKLDNQKLGDFLEAKDQTLKADTISLEKVYVKYLIGACYLQMKKESKNTIPYIEYVINSGYAEAPEIVNIDLGKIYHKDYQFNKAIYYFDKYLQRTSSGDEYYDFAKRMIKICENAKLILKDTLENEIFNINKPINTIDSESKPLVTASNEIIVYTFKQYIKDPRKEKGKPIIIKQVKIAHKQLGIWKKPQTLIFDMPDDIKGELKVIGMSYGGAELYVKINRKNKIEYYSTVIDNYRCHIYNKISFLSSKYDVNRLTISPEVKEAFFSAKIPNEGFGGYDIYKVDQNKNGRWKKPENVGATINTPYDEINPVIVTETGEMYFSSNGHNTIGGYDIFKSNPTSEGGWKAPKNIGFPINTTGDNTDFYVSNRGNTGYFSVSQYDKYNNRDIYTVNLRENIPITIINGKLLGGENSKPIKATIRILNNENKQKYLLSTNPNKKDGKYYVFCPPGEDYELLIEAEGYLPQLVNIYVPKQSYFYELFQEVQLRPIKVLDKKLGEEIIVKNTFYDVKREYADSLEIDTDKPEYNEFVELVNEAIEKDKQDSVHVGKNVEEKDYTKLFNFVESAIEEEDSVSLNLINEKVASQDNFSQSYFFEEGSSDSQLYKKNINGQIVTTAPPVNAIAPKRKAKPTLELKEFIQANRIISLLPDSVTDIYNVSEPEKIDSTETDGKQNGRQQARNILSYAIHFNSNSWSLDSVYHQKLQEVIDLMINNDDLKIEIAGYSNSIGGSNPNMELSKKRAMSVMEFFIDQDIKKERIILKYYGESKAIDEQTEEDRKWNRRVELTIFKYSNSD